MLAETTATHPDDAVLLAALRSGDGSAAKRMMQRHNRTLWHVARGILGDDAEAEEAVQDTWLRAFAGARDFRGEASLGTWLARIAVHEALRRAEKRRSTVALDPIVELLPLDHPGSATMAPPVGPEQAAARAEIGRMVEQAIDTLPWPFRAVFMMRVVEQMSIEETATALDIPVATVKTRLHRANQQLRNVLGSTFSAVLEDSFPFGGLRCARLTEAVLARLAPDSATDSCLAEPPSGVRRMSIWIRSILAATTLLCLTGFAAEAAPPEQAPPPAPFRK